ncbi:MAG TPA: GNAT family N-acetyltransferase [Thermoanaerobaculia bacterium]|nr:GNAT family N-acetyltransferase [Thermoanaerobaculia bacterium]
MDVRVISNPDDFESLGPEWLELWRRSPEATPFQSPMWLLPWWRHFGSNDLHVIEGRENGTLAALAPLYILRDDSESLGLFIGTGISDYLDVVGRADFFQHIEGCAVWDFQQLRATSAILTAKPPDGWSDNVEDQDPCVVLPLADFAPSTHARKKLRYDRRSLERRGRVTIESADRENLNDLLHSLYDLHAARWQRRGMPGMLADDVIQAFHRDVSRAMLDAGALRMYAMRLDDRPIAVFYGFADSATVYYYLSGYDPELEKVSPGTLIVAHAIDCAVREGATTFDFLRGAEDYKYTWGAKDRMNKRRQLLST